MIMLLQWLSHLSFNFTGMLTVWNFKTCMSCEGQGKLIPYVVRTYSQLLLHGQNNHMYGLIGSSVFSAYPTLPGIYLHLVGTCEKIFSNSITSRTSTITSRSFIDRYSQENKTKKCNEIVLHLNSME